MFSAILYDDLYFSFIVFFNAVLYQGDIYPDFRGGKSAMHGEQYASTSFMII